MLLGADPVSLGQPRGELGVHSPGPDSRNACSTLRGENVSTRRNRGLSIRRARMRWPFSQSRRGMNAAKLIRTCRAMRVFSASTWTGPTARTQASAASKAARTCGLDRAKWSSRSPRAAQACDWFRLAKLRPHDGHVHMPVTTAAPRSAQPSQPRRVALGQGEAAAVAGQDAGMPVPSGCVRARDNAGRLAG